MKAGGEEMINLCGITWMAGDIDSWVSVRTILFSLVLTVLPSLGSATSVSWHHFIYRQEVPLGKGLTTITTNKFALLSRLNGSSGIIVHT